MHLGATQDDEGREITPFRSFGYDTLVLAVGSVTNDFGTPGAARFAVPLETPEQAARFNRRLVNACLRAHSQHGEVRPGQLYVAIIGAGATGTELAAELHRTVREVVAQGLDRVDAERDVRVRATGAAAGAGSAPAGKFHGGANPPGDGGQAAGGLRVQGFRVAGIARATTARWAT